MNHVQNSSWKSFLTWEYFEALLLNRQFQRSFFRANLPDIDSFFFFSTLRMNQTNKIPFHGIQKIQVFLVSFLLVYPKCSKTLFFFSVLDIYFCPNLKSWNVCWTNTSKNTFLTILQRNTKTICFNLLPSLFGDSAGWTGRWKWRKWKIAKKSQAFSLNYIRCRQMVTYFV